MDKLARLRSARGALVAVAVLVVVAVVATSTLLLLPPAASSPSAVASGTTIARVTPTASPTPIPTSTPIPTASPTPTASPSASVAPTATLTPLPSPTINPARPTTLVDSILAATVRNAGAIRSGYTTTGTWASVGSTLMLSTDNGQTWTTTTLPPVGDDTMGIDQTVVLDGTHVWALRAGPDTDRTAANPVVSLVLNRTSDGGKTWKASAIPGNFVNGTINLLAADATHGFLIFWAWDKQGAIVYSSADGGATWKAGPVRAISHTYGVAGSSTLWASSSGGGGMCMDCNQPTLMVSRDSGVTWNNVTIPGVPAVSAANAGVVAPPTFFDASNGLLAVHTQTADMVTGTTQVYRTTDGGRTWQKTGSAIPAWVQMLVFVDRTHWISGQVWTADRTRGPFVSSDGGKTWTEQPANAGSVNPASLPWFTDAGHGATLMYPTVGGGVGAILYLTQDGGRNWQPVWFGRWPQATATDAQLADQVEHYFIGYRATNDWTTTWQMLSDFSKREYGSQQAFATKEKPFADSTRNAGQAMDQTALKPAPDGIATLPLYADVAASADVDRGSHFSVVYTSDGMTHSEQLVVAPLKGTQFWRVWIVGQS